MRILEILTSVFLIASFCLPVLAADTPPPFQSPKGAVEFKGVTDGATVKSPLKVKMHTNLKIRPAGEDPNDHTSGHHHIIIDGNTIPAGEVIPTDDKHLHFGKGQTEAELKLTPGAHTLTLQFADGAHRSYGPELSRTIRIVVK